VERKTERCQSMFLISNRNASRPVLGAKVATPEFGRPLSIVAKRIQSDLVRDVEEEERQ
jgi:hypothetical protein